MDFVAPFLCDRFIILDINIELYLTCLLHYDSCFDFFAQTNYEL